MPSPEAMQIITVRQRHNSQVRRRVIDHVRLLLAFPPLTNEQCWRLATNVQDRSLATDGVILERFRRLCRG